MVKNIVKCVICHTMVNIYESFRTVIGAMCAFCFSIYERVLGGNSTLIARMLTMIEKFDAWNTETIVSTGAK